jgi:succinoglycan biosynthesis protein ExoV
LVIFQEDIDMKMIYFKTTRPNFGDELNVWLWPRLLPGFLDDDESTLFLGIGSILYDSFPRDSKKIVFGSGYGGYTSLPTIDESWKFHFVRGRLTAGSLGIDPSLGLGDAAILLRSCVEVRPQRKHAVSYMPHWESAANGEWSEVCALAGMHYIDPCASVEQVLDDIMSSGLVITESMHGAIVSDALRIPWIPVAPILAEHRMKWLDWASALDLTISPLKLNVSNAFELSLRMTRGNKRWTGRIGKRARALRHVARNVFIHRAAEGLSRIAKTTPSLSEDRVIERAHETMVSKLEILRRDHANT